MCSFLTKANLLVLRLVCSIFVYFLLTIVGLVCGGLSGNTHLQNDLVYASSGTLNFADTLTSFHQIVCSTALNYNLTRERYA